MQDLKQKLTDQGLAGSLTIRETGQKIPLRFARGETKKLCRLELGPTSVDVELCLVDIPDAKPGQANLTLAIVRHGLPVAEAEGEVVTAPAVEADDAAAKEAAEQAAKEAAEQAAKDAAEAAEQAEKEASDIPVETPIESSESVAPSNAGVRGNKRGR